MSKRDLLDLAALSDPTDTHSLEELRQHLEDGGDMEPAMEDEIALWVNKIERLQAIWQDEPTALSHLCGLQSMAQEAMRLHYGVTGMRAMTRALDEASERSNTYGA